ncbi:hypothetical protein KFK09_026688 [Dendrobium nobile]|uniref:Uncharacterized protein n=1 Tax=Dendrobium nobile TaxID=94219 RepID=A0A8T3A7I6_DENNO|nr:hypothetical protein KFK09_026688 [Dendrobium nobile]
MLGRGRGRKSAGSARVSWLRMEIGIRSERVERTGGEQRERKQRREQRVRTG